MRFFGVWFGAVYDFVEVFSWVSFGVTYAGVGASAFGAAVYVVGGAFYPGVFCGVRCDVVDGPV